MAAARDTGTMPSAMASTILRCCSSAAAAPSRVRRVAKNCLRYSSRAAAAIASASGLTFSLSVRSSPMIMSAWLAW